eukprot:508523-Alexandrium_andersonii.AAC.1
MSYGLRSCGSQSPCAACRRSTAPSRGPRLRLSDSDSQTHNKQCRCRNATTTKLCIFTVTPSTTPRK